jgi:hypothetical protein
VNPFIISVTSPGAAPMADLLLQGVSLSAAGFPAGDKVSTYSTLHNIGNALAGSGNLGYYLSTDPTWDASDILLGASNGAAVAAGNSAYRTDSLTIPAATNPGNYYILFYADYLALVTESNENNNIAHVAVSISAPTGISSSSSANSIDFKVYPNPSVGKFTVELGGENNSEESIDILVVNLLGETVFHKSCLFRNGKEEIELPADLAAGSYFLQAGKDKRMLSKKILINK